MGTESKKAIDANGVDSARALDAVKTLLRYIGEDPNRNGLLETPDRFCRALLEMTSGYRQNPEEILSTTFSTDSDGIVLLKDIEFSSLCEHHLLGFKGKVHIGYIPNNGKIVGLSKLARIVDTFANRLQVQERLTDQIAQAIQTHLKPSGVGVVIEASHSCMCMRGIKKQNSVMITSSMLGDFRTSHTTRAEFMALVKNM